MPKFYLWLSACALGLILFSCGGGKPSVPPQQYRLEGEIVRLDSQVRTATIKHKKIDGWMEAMTMEFPVHEARDFEKLKVGQKISATVYVRGDDFWIGNVEPESSPKP